VAASPDYHLALGDLQARAGNPDRARASYDFAVYMGGVNGVRRRSLGRELALFLPDHDLDLDEAVVLARTEASARDDVYTSDVLAWVRFKLVARVPLDGRLARFAPVASAAIVSLAGLAILVEALARIAA
jgi:hypothetical protein